MGRGPLALVGAVVAIAVAVFVAFGVGGGGSSPSTPFSPIAEAAERTANLPGVRVSGTGTGTAQGIQVNMTLDGVFDGESGRSQMEMQMSSPQQPQLSQAFGSMTAVQDGLVIYMHAPLFEAGVGKPWMKIDLAESTGLDADALTGGGTDARGTLEALRATSADARVVGSERVRGVMTTHYAATLDPALEAQQLRDMGADQAAEIVESEGAGAAVDVWVGDKDHYVHRLAEAVPFSLVGGDGSQLSMTLDFYDYGVERAISIPPADQVFDATELAQQGVEQALEGS